MRTHDCPMTTQELYDLIASAQQHLQDAISDIRQYVAMSGDTHTERTILANLECLTSRDHQWLARDHNLDDVLDGLGEGISPDDDEGEQELRMTRQCAGQPALTWRDANPWC